MNFIIRFLAWIIRGAAMIAGALGLIMIVVGALGERTYLILGIILLVVSVVIGKFAMKKGDKAKVNSLNKCKKCGASMSGARYEYKYNSAKANKSPISGLYQVGVDINAYCPHCGKYKYICETVEVCRLSEEEIENAITNKIEHYFKD